jgi:hypothetical protein
MTFTWVKKDKILQFCYDYGENNCNAGIDCGKNKCSNCNSYNFYYDDKQYTLSNHSKIIFDFLNSTLDLKSIVLLNVRDHKFGNIRKFCENILKGDKINFRIV